MNIRGIAWMLCVVALAPLPARAQNFGEITGTVTDPSGAVVSAAVVTLTNLATNQQRRITTNQTGNFSMPFLVPGGYSVKVESPGFKTATRPDIVLQVGAVQRVDFVLEVGEITQNVEVSSAAPLLTTENTSVGTVIENRRVVELPLNGRNYLQLVKLSTNVTGEMGGGGEAATRVGGERTEQSISVAGQRQQFNHYTLDGVENTEVSYNLFLVRPSIDALQEFKVQTGIYPAEYGRATSQISVATKSGTNAFHGTAFEFLRNDKFDAREWNKVGSEKNPFRRNQYGFTFGGRLVPNRVFFMSNFEALKDRKTTQGLANVATDRMLSGDFGGQSRPIYDPLSRVFGADAQGNLRALSAAPFAGNRIPQERFHPIAQKLLEFYPRATRPGDSILSNYVRPVPAPISWEQFIQRVDWNQSDKLNWFGRFSWNDEFVRQRATFPAQQGTIQTKTYQAMISNSWVLNPSMVNEFRFGYSQFQNAYVNRFAYERDVSSELGITGLQKLPPDAWGLPSVGLADGLSGFGDAVQSPTVMVSHIFQWLDNFSIVRGKHTIKFGGEFRRDRFNEIGDAFTRGTFNFASPYATGDPNQRATTGHSFADYLLGEVRLALRTTKLANALLRGSSAAAYIDDTWKITPRLTISLGLRYEYWQPWYDKYRGIANLQMFDPGVGPQGLLPGTRTPIFTRAGSGDFYEGLPFRFIDTIPVQAGDDFLGRSLVGSDRNNFAPRIGFAYSPAPRWSFRAGFGVFYVQDTAHPRFDMARNLSGRSDYTANTEKPDANLSNPWAPLSALYKCSNWDGVCVPTPFVLQNNPGRRTPYVMQWMFNIQRQLTQSTAVELGYQGNAGHKLERLRMYNDAILRTGPNDTRTPAQRRPWGASYGQIQTVDNVVNSNYNAASVKLQRTFSRGLTYLAGFTFGKAIDNGSGIRPYGFDNILAKNSYDLKGERGLSQFHTARRFVTSILYEIPAGPRHLVGRQMGPAAKILEGWQIGSILTFSDGTPLTVGGIGDLANLGLSNSSNFPDATGVSPIPSDRSASRFWNRAAFDPFNPELAYRFGTTGRNTLLTPGVKQWDFSLLKNTRIREGHALEFRFEAFNFPNHPNWNTPSADSRNAGVFGIVTAARTMRELQFGLKYMF